MDTPTVRELLGREPTKFEEELAIFMIRTGHRYDVMRILQGGMANGGDSIRAIGDVTDLLIEAWANFTLPQQQHVRQELRTLLWRIRGPTVTESWLEAVRALNPRDMPDVDLVTRGLQHAADTWAVMNPEQRAVVREFLRHLSNAIARARAREDDGSANTPR